MSKLRVTYIQRRSRLGANFSIETVFAQVRESLGDRFLSEVATVPNFSNGLLPRLSNIAFARKFRKNICHVTGDINYTAIGLDACRTILTNHDCGYLKRVSGLRYVLLKFFWLTLPSRRCRFITTVSNEARNDLLKYIPQYANKTVVIYNPIGRHFTRCDAQGFRSRPRLLQIGTAYNKNLQRTVEAIAGMACDLVIIGKVPPDITALMKRHAISHENLSDLTPQEVVRQYQLADIVLFPSLLEGFGMPIIEANAVGRPVLTSNISSMPEVAGDAACLVNPMKVSSIREGIRKLIESPNYRHDLVQRGFRNVERFSPRSIAAQYEQLYFKIAEENGLFVNQ